MAHLEIVNGPSHERLQDHFFNPKAERPKIYFSTFSNLDPNRKGDDRQELTIEMEVVELRALNDDRTRFAYGGPVLNKEKFSWANGEYFTKNRSGTMSISLSESKR